jgi:glycerol-3-phosphate cytidylyltransferase
MCIRDRCTGDYIFLLQADELIHEDQLPELKKLILSGEHNSISFRFHHIRFDLEYSLNEGYQRASRVVKNEGTYSCDDGYEFAGNISPKCTSNINIYHYGYVFLENILAKMVNHADNFYVSSAGHTHRKQLCQEFLVRIHAGERLDSLELQKILEPFYTLKKHGLPMPKCMERLLGATKYTLPAERSVVEPVKIVEEPIVVRHYFDLDETLCLTPASREYAKSVPLPKVIAEMNRLYDEINDKTTNEIIIYTARGGTSGIDYSDLCVHQLTQWGAKYHRLDIGNKPPYDVLVDDKAINVKAWREQRGVKLVGFVASCFDLLHAGHCLYLEESKSKCDYLIAALQRNPTDRPDKNKPIQSVEERLIQLRACRYVDEIIQYDTEEDLVAILENIKPDIRFVGSDTNPNKVTGFEYCTTVFVHNRSYGYSSSELRQRIIDV